jgi:hypothetical protein
MLLKFSLKHRRSTSMRRRASLCRKTKVSKPFGTYSLELLTPHSKFEKELAGQLSTMGLLLAFVVGLRAILDARLRGKTTY